MRRLIPVILLLAAFAAGASAQTSNVTATITDADSQTWNNGTYTISFVQPPNDATAPVWNGTLMTPSQKIYTGSLSGSGVLTVALPDNTFITPGGSLWLFVICPNATAQCTQVSLKVSGASPDLSTTLSNATITPRFSALLNAFGYLDVEVTPTPVPGGQYFNVTNEVTRVWSGSAWANQGSASGGGTVTSFSAGNLSPLFTTSTATGTTTPALSFASISQAQNLFYASPNGSSGVGAWRAILAADLPTGTVSAAGTLTNNFLVLGGGTQAVSTNTAFTTDGLTKLTIGTSGNGNGQLALSGNVSGAATITAPSTAGTAGNAIVFSNAGSFGGQVTGLGFNSDVNHCFFFTGRGQLCSGSADGVFVFTSNTTSVAANRLTLGPDNSSNLALCPTTNVLKVGAGGAACSTLSGVTTGTFTGNLYATGTNCSSSASPAVCAAAAAGSVAIPAGATQTLQVNTTAVTANSQIMLTVDEGLGTKLGVTCNTTVATLTQPIVTARTAATSFTIEEPATTATNPVCVSYLVFN